MSPTTYDKMVEIMGPRKLLEFEYVYSIYEILIFSISSNLFELPTEKSEIYYSNKFSLILRENNFFSTSLEYFFKYELNNCFHKSFEDLFAIVLSFEDKDLYDHFFIYLNLLDRIIETCLETKFLFNSGKFMNNGTLPFLLEISHKISTTKSEYIFKLLKERIFFIDIDPKWEIFFSNFVQPVRKRFATGLKYEIKSDICKDEFSRDSPSNTLDVPEFTEVRQF